jgi:DNA polymerase-3 subunit gamma/tau
MVLLRMLAFAPGREGVPLPASRAASAPPTPAPAAPAAIPAAAPSAASRSAAAMPEPPAWLDAPPPDDDTPTAGGSAALRASAPPAMAVPAGPPESAAPAEPPRAAVALVVSPQGERWAELVGRMVQAGSIAALVRELAQQAGLERIDGSTQPATWHLVVERDSLRTELLRDKLGAALASELGEPVQLALQAGVPQVSPARRDAAERDRRQRLAEEAIRSDPLVVELMSQFKTARIVPGSIKPL